MLLCLQRALPPTGAGIFRKRHPKSPPLICDGKKRKPAHPQPGGCGQPAVDRQRDSGRSPSVYQSKPGVRPKVLVHCNQGMSRSPGIGLLYLAKEGMIDNSSFEKALAEFKEIYPGVNMAGGMRGFLEMYRLSVPDFLEQISVASRLKQNPERDVRL